MLFFAMFDFIQLPSEEGKRGTGRSLHPLAGVARK